MMFYLPALSYGFASLGLSIIHNIFVLYYVDLFVSHYKIDEFWFYWGQIVFAIWNSFNDPIMGYISDFLQKKNHGIHSHIFTFRYVGPIFSLCFLLSFFPFASPVSPDDTSATTSFKAILVGLHFVLAICAYDGLLTWVSLRMSGLLVDVSLNNNTRNYVLKYGSIGSMLGSISVFISYLFWADGRAPTPDAPDAPDADLPDHHLTPPEKNPQEESPDMSILIQFRYFACVLAVISAASFVLASFFLQASDDTASKQSGASQPSSSSPTVSTPRSTTYSEQNRNRRPVGGKEGGVDGYEEKKKTSGPRGTTLRVSDTVPSGPLEALRRAVVESRLFLILSQILTHPNYLVYVAVDLIQVFNCHFISNFFPLFLTHVMGQHASAFTRALVMGLAYIIPHFLVVLLHPFLDRFGAYAVIRSLFAIKFVISAVTWVFGSSNVAVLAIYMLSTRIFTEGTCRIMALPVGDIIDEDRWLRQRPYPLSAFMFGLVALLTRPGQTLAPLTGVSLLNQHGYISRHHMKEQGGREMLFSMMVLAPLFCAAAQFLLWGWFNLHGSYLRKVKARVAAASGKPGAVDVKVHEI